MAHRNEQLRLLRHLEVFVNARQRFDDLRCVLGLTHQAHERERRTHRARLVRGFGLLDQRIQRLTKAELAEVIRPRVTAIVHQIRQRLEACEMTAYAGRSLVLTGGTSQLAGLADFVAHELGRPVRIGVPRPISGLPPAFSGAAFSSAVGLLLAQGQDGVGRRLDMSRKPETGGYLKRVGSWLREGF